MGRRSDHSREELYELALATARRIVEKDGLTGLTARKVAGAMGYAPGTLYNLFGNLDDMIVHLNARTLDDLSDRLSMTLGTGSPDEVLGKMLSGYLDFFEDHSNLWNLLFEHNISGNREIPDWYARKVSKVLGLVEKELSPLFAEDRQGQRRDAACILWASLHGICSLYQAGKLDVLTSTSVREMAEALLSNFIAGLRFNQAPNGGSDS